MNKAELIEKVVDRVGIPKKDVGNVVDAFIATVSNSLSRGEKVTLVGFGTFQVIERKATRGVNPQTGEEIQIPAKKVPKFVPGKSLQFREDMRKKYQETSVWIDGRLMINKGVIVDTDAWEKKLKAEWTEINKLKGRGRKKKR